MPPGGVSRILLQIVALVDDERTLCSEAPPRILLHDDELPLLDRREEGGDVVAVAADRQVELGELADIVGAWRGL